MSIKKPTPNERMDTSLTLTKIFIVLEKSRKLIKDLGLDLTNEDAYLLVEELDILLGSE